MGIHAYDKLILGPVLYDNSMSHISVAILAQATFVLLMADWLDGIDAAVAGAPVEQADWLGAAADAVDDAVETVFHNNINNKCRQ